MCSFRLGQFEKGLYNELYIDIFIIIFSIGPLTAFKKHVSPEPESIVKGSRHECDYCKFVGISPDVLRTHKESNHQCRSCCYQGSSSELMCHKRFRHKDLQHPCDQCEYATNDVEDFNLHKEMRHKTCESNIVNVNPPENSEGRSIDEIFPCDQCKYEGANSPELNYHAKYRHKGSVALKKIFKLYNKIQIL